MISNTSNSLLVYPNKCRQQANAYYQQRNTEEETASEYLLIPDSEQQIEMTNNLEKENYSEKLIHTQQSEQIIKSTQSRIANHKISNTNNSLLVHPNKVLQQSYSYFNSRNMEEETASEYLLVDESDKETEKTNKSEKSIRTQQSERSIKSKQTNKTNQQSSINTNKLHQNQQNKSQKQSYSYCNSRNMEEETASEYLLVDESDKETEKTNKSEKSIHTQQSERSIKSKQTNKTNQQSSTIKIQPPKIQQQPATSNFNEAEEEEDFASEFLLQDESEPEPTRPKSEPKINDTKSSSQISVHEPATPKSLNSSPKTKKAVTTSTYDPSIFYTQQQQDAASSTPIRHSRFSYKIPLTVTLKDIGLEGLDSATIEKFDSNDKKNADRKRLKKRNHKNECVKNKSKQSGVVCKINSFISTSSSQSSSSAKKCRQNHSGRKVIEPFSPCENVEVKKPKCGSLLDSTQKHKRSQTIKPKTHSKSRNLSKKSEKF